MIVIDSSALVAIMLGEPEAEVFRARIAAAPGAVSSSVSIMETGMVLFRAQGGTGRG